MCIWGGKLETYQLLQGSGEENFFTGKVKTAGRAHHHWESAAALREWKWGCIPFRGISNSWEEGGTRPVGGRVWEAGDWRVVVVVGLQGKNKQRLRAE